MDPSREPNPAPLAQSSQYVAAAHEESRPGRQRQVTRAVCPVVLARGEGDAMVTEADLRALVPEPVTLPGLGHNAHVEDPAAVVELVRRKAFVA
jgi:pimeloyl-ACP methyl ester carboxylesterase